jgi:FixJ family two-component response regulator
VAARGLVSVVDDDISVRESRPELLRSFGFEVEAFPSAEAFLGSESLERTACLVLDIGMPGMSGFELQDELLRRRLRIPIVFITARSVERARAQAMAGGAFACLNKPFSEEAILQVVSAALSRE